MFKKLKALLSNKSYSKLLSNFSYLSFIAIANKLLPLIILPYIIRTIGIEKFGVITFAWALISFFILLTNYSFGLTSVEYISQNRTKQNLLNNHIWTVLSIRILFAFGIFCLFLIALFSIEKLQTEMIVMLFTFIMVFADVLMPLFFFKGIEEMKYIAIFNIIAKSIYTLSIFVFIHEESDYIYIPLLNGLTTFAVSIYALFYIHKKFNVSMHRPTIPNMVFLIKKGKDIFLSNLSVSFYTTLNPILLGSISGYTAVGIYSLAEAIFNAFSTIIKSFTMVIHPYLARHVDKQKKLYQQAQKFFFLYLFILIFSALFLYTLAGTILTLLYGEGHQESIFIMQILAVSLILEPLGNFFTFYLSIKGQHKTIRNITFTTMLVNLILVVPMIYLYGAIGVAYLFLILSVLQVYLNMNQNNELFIVNFNARKN